MKVKLPVITTEIIDEYIGVRLLEYDMENLQWTWTQDAVDFACLIAAAPAPEQSEVEMLRKAALTAAEYLEVDSGDDLLPEETRKYAGALAANLRAALKQEKSDE